MRRFTRWHSFNAPPLAFPYVLGAIAKGLLHAKYDRVRRFFKYATINPIAPTGREFNTNDAHVSALEECIFRSVTWNRFRFDVQ